MGVGVFDVDSFSFLTVENSFELLSAALRPPRGASLPLPCLSSSRPDRTAFRTSLRPPAQIRRVEPSLRPVDGISAVFLSVYTMGRQHCLFSSRAGGLQKKSSRLESAARNISISCQLSDTDELSLFLVLFKTCTAHANPAVDDFLGDRSALDDEDHTVVLLRVIVVDTTGIDGD